MVNMLTRGCDARTYGEFYGLMKFIFVGWTEMCSRHGDTAKLNIDGAGFLFLLVNLFDRKLVDSKQHCQLKVTATLCRWNGALRFVSVWILD